MLLYLFTIYCFNSLLVCRHWYRLSRQHWLSIKFLHFKNVFSVFRPECCPALTDNILLSLLKRCSGQLQCLDLSDSPRMITDYGLDIIGKPVKFKISCNEYTSLVINKLLISIYKYS